MSHKKRVISILRNKKAISYEVFFDAFQVILGIIVALAIVNFVQSVVERTIFEKNYLARDLGTLTNTLYSAPGDVNYDYKENTGKFAFIFGFSPNKVEVKDATSAEKSILRTILKTTSGIGQRDLSSEGEQDPSHEAEQAELNAPAFYLFGEDKKIAFSYTNIESDEGTVSLNFVKSNNQITVSKGNPSISYNP